MPWFPQHEAEKGGKQEHQPRGKSTPSNQAAEKSFVCGQELRWAEEGLCTTDDSYLATGFGGQVGNVVFPGKIMADSETQKIDERTSSRGLLRK